MAAGEYSVYEIVDAAFRRAVIGVSELGDADAVLAASQPQPPGARCRIVASGLSRPQAKRFAEAYARSALPHFKVSVLDG